MTITTLVLAAAVARPQVEAAAAEMKARAAEVGIVQRQADLLRQYQLAEARARADEARLAAEEKAADVERQRRAASGNPCGFTKRQKMAHAVGVALGGDPRILARREAACAGVPYDDTADRLDDARKALEADRQETERLRRSVDDLTNQLRTGR